MTFELQTLALSIVLGFVHIVLASHAKSWRYGYRWTASARDEHQPPLTGVAGRLERAAINFIETFPFFAAAVLIASSIGRHNALTYWGVVIFLGTGALPAALCIRRASVPVDRMECRSPRDCAAINCAALDPMPACMPFGECGGEHAIISDLDQGARPG